jgi:hypothetical protein
MKLEPLKPVRGDAAENVMLWCSVKAKNTRWNDAAAEGWMVNIYGMPFHVSSYYSPERIKYITEHKPHLLTETNT